MMIKKTSERNIVNKTIFFKRRIGYGIYKQYKII